MKFLIPIFLSLAIGCAHKTVKQSQENRALLFPNGAYQHNVRVEIPGKDSNKGKTFEFRGVVQLSAMEIKVVGLSPMNSTLFRITEDRKSKELKIETFNDAVKKSETQIREFYTVIREMLLTPYPGYQLVRRLVQTSFGQVMVVFEQYDENKIPNLIRIEGEKFNIRVEVPGYEI